MATTLQSLIASITPEQINRCHRIVGPDGKVFYQVDNERGELDGDGLTIEYTVRFTPGKGFTCTCAAGLNAFKDCHYSTCKHCRWAYRAAQEYKAEVARNEHIVQLELLGLTQEEAKNAVTHQLLIDGQPADDETLVRVWGARDRRPSELEMEHAAQCYQASAFHLMR